MSGVHKEEVASPVSSTQPAAPAVRSRSDVETQEGKRLLERGSLESWKGHGPDYTRHWLSSPHDYLHYYLSYGGHRHLAKPSWVTQNFSAEVDAISSASTTSSHKADSVIGNPPTSVRERDPQTNADVPSFSSLIERAAGIKERLRREPQLGGTDESLEDIADAFNGLVLDYSRSVAIQCMPASQSASNRRRNGGLQHHAASAINNPKGKSPGKQSIRDEGQDGDGEPSVADCEPSKEKTSTRLRCFYCFGTDLRGNFCDKTKVLIRDLVKHWESHGVYYCGMCSQSFRDLHGREQFNRHKATHEENRVCIDIGCENLPALGYCHARRNGCEDLRSRDKMRKYYSLFRLALPDTQWPPWPQIEIDSNGYDNAQDLTEGQSVMGPVQDAMDFDSLDDSPFAQSEYPQATMPVLSDDMSMSWRNETMPTNNSTDNTSMMQQEIDMLRAQQHVQQVESDHRISQLQATVDREREERQELARRVDMLMEMLRRTQAGAMAYVPSELGNDSSSINPADLQRRP